MTVARKSKKILFVGANGRCHPLWGDGRSNSMPWNCKQLGLPPCSVQTWRATGVSLLWRTSPRCSPMHLRNSRMVLPTYCLPRAGDEVDDQGTAAVYKLKYDILCLSCCYRSLSPFCVHMLCIHYNGRYLSSVYQAMYLLLWGERNGYGQVCPLGSGYV